MKQASSRHQAELTFSDIMGRRLREGMLIIFASIAIYLFIALFSYHGEDPGWSQTGSTTEIINLAGKTGAWFSDLLLFLFGYMAYFFPIAIILIGVFLYNPQFYGIKTHPGIWLVRVFGLGLAMASSCGLTSLHFVRSVIQLPVSTGGVLGTSVKLWLVGHLNYVGSTVILLAFFLTGITLFTGLSWLKVMELTGRYSFLLIDKIQEFCGWVGRNLFWLAKNIKLSGLFSLIKSRFGFVKKFTSQLKKSSTGLAPVSDGPSVSFVGPIDDDELPPFDSIAEYLPGGRKSKINGFAKKFARKKHKSSPVKKEASVQPKARAKSGDPLVAPSLSLLDEANVEEALSFNREELEGLSKLVESRLAEFGVEVKVVSVHPGPVVTRFEMELAAGVKVSKVTGLAKDLARSLSVVSVRVVEIIPGKSTVGLEIPNQQRELVRLRDILTAPSYQNSESPLSLGLGKDISGRSITVDLAKMPHLLVAGTTGSGKSVGVNAMLLSILYKASPEEVRMILIDPKMLELAVYDNIPHLLTPVVTDMKDAANALRWCVGEMEYRYQLMAALGVRNIKGYNEKIEAAMKAKQPIYDPLWEPHVSEQPEVLTKKPYIVVVIDEFADMMMVVGKKVEELIARIAQKARAAGIHLILATQRPSVDVITGLIKANIPTRIAYQVSSRIDSRTILDQHGAEQLLGHGDMLYLPPGMGVPLRIHGAFVADDEVHKVTSEWRKQGVPDYIENIVATSSGGYDNAPGMEDYDELYDEAVLIVTESRRASISNIQRRLKIGYNRAARLIEQMEADGIVSPMQSNGGREVLAPPPPER